MCIICIKPIDTEDFNDDILKYCWDKNDDGAGFAYWDREKNLWSVEKGFLKFNKFKRAYRAHNFGKEDLSIVHFRIGTSGLKDKGNTHPFQVCDDYEKMRQKNFSSSAIAFHNGVVGKGEGDFSDTMVHISQYLFPIFPLWEDKRIHEHIADDLLTKSGSRWVVCVGDTYHLYGTFHDYKGWKFSNTNYKSYEAPKHTLSYGCSTYYPSRRDYDVHDPDFIIIRANKWYPENPWVHGSKDGKEGFWKSGAFTTWADYLAGRRALPPPTQSKMPKIYNCSDFLQRYFVTFCTKKGKCVSIMNWRVFSQDMRIQEKERKEDPEKSATAKALGLTDEQIVTAIVGDDGSLAWEDDNTKEKMIDELKDYKMCPSCFDESVLCETPFTVGDTICLSCGCVFTLETGEIHTYDVDLHNKYLRAKKV